MTHVDRDFLAPAGLHLVNVGDCDTDTGKDVCRCLADLEARGEDGIMSVIVTSPPAGMPRPRMLIISSNPGFMNSSPPKYVPYGVRATQRLIAGSHLTV